MDEKETKRLRSVIAVKKTSDEDEDKIIEAYDDYPQNNEGYDDEGIKKRNLDVGNKEKDLYDTGIREEATSSKDRGQLVKDSDAGGVATKNYSMRKESEIVGEYGGKEADDLELILRQKALENLKKFRGVRPAKKESFSDKKDESSKLESCQGSQSFMKTSESNPRSSLDDQRHVQGGINPNKLEARSVANIPTDKIDGNAVRDLSNDTGVFKPVDRSIANQNTLNQFKRMHESSEKISSEESSLTKDSQNKKIVSLSDIGKVGRAEIDTIEKPASDALNTENQNCKANEPMVESASGSQFEQKTFSRVCDGETVQVSCLLFD